MLRRMPRLTPPLQELDGLSDQELREHYDTANDTGQPWHVNFYRDEMRRRQSATSEMVMRRLTWVIAGLTAVNVAAVIVTLCVS
jgi:hypothetical protein